MRAKKWTAYQLHIGNINLLYIFRTGFLEYLVCVCIARVQILGPNSRAVLVVLPIAILIHIWVLYGTFV
jgi:hypothetical protein